MTLLAVYGLPQAKPFDWACDNGYGFSLRVTPMLWQRDKVAEVYKLIPEKKEDDSDIERAKEYQDIVEEYYPIETIIYGIKNNNEIIRKTNLLEKLLNNLNKK